MDPRGALEAFIRWVMRDTLYLASYPSEVQGQADDGLLELLPDDERVRGTGLSRVPIRHGLPGVTVRVPVGARVLLAFEGGDPRRPIATLWEEVSIESISFDGGEAPIARVGDSVACFWPPGALLAATVAGVVPLTGVVTFTSSAPGIIRGGAEKVRA